MIHDRAQFERELDLAIDQVRVELKNRRAGAAGVGTPEQLEPILGTLETLARQVRSGTVPPPPDRHRVCGGMIYMVVDSWDFNHPLSLRLAEIWGYYIEKL